MSPEIIGIIVGVFSVLIGIYYREHLKDKNEKIKTAHVLKANLLIFYEKSQENPTLNKVLTAGFALNDRYTSAVVTGDDKKYKEFVNYLDEAKERITSDELIDKPTIDEFTAKFKKYSQQEISVITNELDRMIEDIEHGTAIIGRDDIKNLPYFMINRVLKVKRSIIDILIICKLVIIGVHSRNSYDEQEIKLQVYSGFRSAIEAARHVFPLIIDCDKLTRE